MEFTIDRELLEIAGEHADTFAASELGEMLMAALRDAGGLAQVLKDGQVITLTFSVPKED